MSTQPGRVLIVGAGPAGMALAYLLARRGVGNYSLSMSHLFDLTGPSFAALRLPALIAAVVLLIGPLSALHLRRRERHFEATLSVACRFANAIPARTSSTLAICGCSPAVLVCGCLA